MESDAISRIESVPKNAVNFAGNTANQLLQPAVQKTNTIIQELFGNATTATNDSIEAANAKSTCPVYLLRYLIVYPVLAFIRGSC